MSISLTQRQRAVERAVDRKLDQTTTANHRHRQLTDADLATAAAQVRTGHFRFRFAEEWLVAELVVGQRVLLAYRATQLKGAHRPDVVNSYAKLSCT